MSTMTKLFAGFVGLFLLVGCAGSERHVKTTQVEVYRDTTDATDMRTMRELCREVKQQVKYDTSGTGALKKTEVEEFSRDSGPGLSEYRREYRESSRYSAAARDRDKMIELCIQME